MTAFYQTSATDNYEEEYAFIGIHCNKLDSIRSRVHAVHEWFNYICYCVVLCYLFHATILFSIKPIDNAF